MTYYQIFLAGKAVPATNGSKFRTPKLISKSLRMENGIPKLMGILNVTPDSFHADSRYDAVEEATEKAIQMWNQGATWIDIGGESTRPNAQPVSIEEELNRVIPVIESIREKNGEGLISIDTRNVEVAIKAIEAGADLVNDVSGLKSKEMFDFVVENKVPVCIMHMQNNPLNMQENPVYDDVIQDVSNELTITVQRMLDLGYPSDLICIDPGIGFGKTHSHNLALLRAGRDLLRDLDCSILWGVSRKSIIGKICEAEDTNERLAGTLGSTALAFNYGIDLLRVHDVKENSDLLKVMNEIHNRPNA